MSEPLTKDDLRQFAQMIINEIRNDREKPEEFTADWLKSCIVKKLLRISYWKSANQKILGSYY